MSEHEFRWCGKNERNFVERLFVQERRRVRERYVVRPDGVGLSPRPALQVTARQRCRAVRQAMRTRLAQRLLRRLGLPVGLILGILCGTDVGKGLAEAEQLIGTSMLKDRSGDTCFDPGSKNLSLRRWPAGVTLV